MKSWCFVDLPDFQTTIQSVFVFEPKARRRFGRIFKNPQETAACYRFWYRNIQGVFAPRMPTIRPYFAEESPTTRPYFAEDYSARGINSVIPIPLLFRVDSKICEKVPETGIHMIFTPGIISRLDPQTSA